MDGVLTGVEGMTRFFYGAHQLQDGGNVLLEGEDAHHLVRVLRSTPGDTVELCDESGSCRQAVIENITKESVSCRLGEFLCGNEASVRFTLAFGMLKGEKNELVFQKGTELGAAGFMPFFSERTVVRPDKDKETRRQRWQKIVRAAAGQSRRNIIPGLAPPCSWQELLNQAKRFDRVVFFWEGEGDRPLQAALQDIIAGHNVLLVTGPEGGFSEGEAREATAAGFQPATLGPRILRAETAALTALAVSLYQAGEMGGA